MIRARVKCIAPFGHHTDINQIRMSMARPEAATKVILWSSRAMARTGLRMMPTFPSPPLKFRTASLPQYGFKASMSNGAFLSNGEIKPAPSMLSPSLSLRPSFASVPRDRRLGSEPKPVPSNACRRSRGVLPRYPRGPWLRRELCSLAPSSLTTSPSASPTGTLRFHGSAAYTQRLRCAGAPRQPVGPSLLSLLSFPLVPSTLPRRACRVLPLYSRGNTRLPPKNKRVATRNTRLCQLCSTGRLFRDCIVHFMLRPEILPSPPDWLRQGEVTCSPPCLLRYLVTSAFDAIRCRTTLEVRLDGRMGNLPSSGLAPDQLQQLVRLHILRAFAPWRLLLKSYRKGTKTRRITKSLWLRPPAEP